MFPGVAYVGAFWDYRPSDQYATSIVAASCMNILLSKAEDCCKFHYINHVTT